MISATQTTKGQNETVPEKNRTVAGERPGPGETMSQQRAARVSCSNF